MGGWIRPQNPGWIRWQYPVISLCGVKHAHSTTRMQHCRRVYKLQGENISDLQKNILTFSLSRVISLQPYQIYYTQYRELGFIAYSDERWLYYLTSSLSLRVNVLFELGSERIKFAHNKRRVHHCTRVYILQGEISLILLNNILNSTKGRSI